MMKIDIAKKNSGFALTTLILSAFVLLLNLATTHFDGSVQSVMPTAALAFVVGIALASSLRWDRATRYYRRSTSN
jgi:F0F1-type ATP synthase membrane subunit a